MAKNLSKFIFKQLAYDYLAGELSGDELEKFEAKIKAEGDCFDYIELTKKSLSYVGDISKLQVNLESIKGVEDYRNGGLFYLYNPFSFKVPKLIKVGLPVLGIACILLALAYMFPVKDSLNWFQEKQKNFIVNSVDPVADKATTTNVEVKDVKINIDPPVAVNNFKPIKVKENSIGVTKVEKNKNLKIVTEKINSQEFVTKINGMPTIEKVPAIINKKELSAEPVKKQKGPQGTLYRVYMSLRNLDQQTPIIADIIEQMGGEKAGKKELGYLKAKGRSFHFKLSLYNREQVFEQLKDLGRVKIDKEKHWRKMPGGQDRVILWVEDLDLKAERQRSR